MLSIRVAGAVAVMELFGCATAQRAGSPAPNTTALPLWSKVDPPSGFQTADILLCRTVVATHPGFAGGTFVLRGALGATVLVERTTAKSMTRVQDTAERVVYEAGPEDPGSVDTLSLDKRTGAFARVWSGWSLTTPELNAGAERGYCTRDGGL